MAVTLGLVPFDLNVELAADADFVSTITNNVGDWADGTAIELRLSASSSGSSPTVWAATVSGSDASWIVDKTDVATALSAGVGYARLHYIDAAGDDLLWGKGRVSVD